jgi:hypothetical protein
VIQRQRSQNFTSAPEDALGGAPRPNYLHSQFGGILFAIPRPRTQDPGTPAPPAPPGHTRGGFYQADFPPLPLLHLASGCAGRPSVGHTRATPRWAWPPMGSLRRRYCQEYALQALWALGVRSQSLTECRSAAIYIYIAKSKLPPDISPNKPLLAVRRSCATEAPRCGTATQPTAPHRFANNAQSPHSNLCYRGGVSGSTSFWPAPGVV